MERRLCKVSSVVSKRLVSSMSLSGRNHNKPPPAQRVAHPVKFGLVKGENRGNNKDLLFDPPVVREDPYFWLRDDTRKSENVVNYLKQENEYCKTATEHIEGFSNEIYTEMKAHLKETDQEVPYAWGSMGWRYFTRTLEGKSYKLHCRTKSESVLEEDLQGDHIEVVLDENEVAQGKSYCDVGAVSPSPSHNLLAYAVDSTGYETYKVFLKDLETKSLISEEVIEETTGDIEWGLEDSLIFYSKQDKAHRPYQLWVRVRGQSGPDQMLFQEDDERFWLGMWKSRSGKILFLGCRSKETTEVHMINLQDLHESIRAGNKSTGIKDFLKVVSKREQGVIYKVDHMESLDHLIFLSNYNGKQEFTLCASPLDKPSKEHWYEMESFKYDPSKYLLGAYCFKDYLVLSGREDGLTRIWILHLSRDGQGKVDVAKAQRVEFEEEAYEVNFSSRNKIFDADSFRVIYSSMVTPDSTLVVDSKSGKNKVIKVEAVPGYDASKYATLRLEAPARDGTKIPLSIVFKKEEGAEGDIRSQFESKKRPTYLYGYGSYGANMDPSFGMSRLPLLDRGMAYVIAHIRGGSELGRRWYQTEGKYLTKCNTFDDFIDSAKFLRSSGIASKIAIEGRSAGGLLIGASMNRAPPGLFDVAVAGVPFVDVMTTMCDPSIPLTVIEWEEWGNPNESKYHDYILSYSPIDNVSATSCSEAGKEQCGVKDYPALLITAGLHDPRVAYWEPAKWIATMRHVLAESEPLSSENDQPLLLLKTDLTSGHFSASDRYKWLKERSFDYAFVLWQLGLHSPRL